MVISAPVKHIQRKKLNTTFLTTGTKKILLKINERSIEKNDIIIINSEEVSKSHLTLESPNPNDFIDMWEIITAFATIGGAIGFLQLIKSTLIEEKYKQSISITTNAGASININSETSDIEIQEFANKTIITISKNA